VGCAVETLSGEVLVSYHARFGEAHAERRVLDEARERGVSLKGARVAVTLEPCSHYGKTPPCAKALVDAQIAELIVGSEDPFPLVRGRGLEELRNAGIRIEMNVLRDACEALNRAWLFAHRHQRSHLTLKMATSLDGAWASEKGHSQWITSERARKEGHKLRSRVDALITSGATIRRDNPALTARDASELYEFQPKVFVCSRSHPPEDLANYKISCHPRGCEWVQNVDPRKFLERLYEESLYDVMLEAGPSLSQVFLEAGCVDEVWCFLDTQFLGGSSLRWPRAFNGGALPGLKWEILENQQLDSSSLFLKLRPYREKGSPV
jgi:diaminohydroxyphosphoribosylaminopyrimidine deaminase/5-amino-6-(5-phosphoribosylamino)uracil reductase